MHICWFHGHVVEVQEASLPATPRLQTRWVMDVTTGYGGVAVMWQSWFGQISSTYDFAEFAICGAGPHGLETNEDSQPNRGCHVDVSVML